MGMETQDAGTDERLWKDFCEGRADAFPALVQRYQVPFYGTARRIAPSAASDAVQEAFLSMLRAKGTPVERFRPWAFRLLANCALKSLRSERIRKGKEERMPAPRDRFASGGKAEEAEAVRRAVGDLPEELRAVVALRFEQGLSYEEVAESLEIPAGTVSTRLREAKDRLSRALALAGLGALALRWEEALAAAPLEAVPADLAERLAKIVRETGRTGVPRSRRAPKAAAVVGAGLFLGGGIAIWLSRQEPSAARHLSRPASERPAASHEAAALGAPGAGSDGAGSQAGSQAQKEGVERTETALPPRHFVALGDRSGVRGGAGMGVFARDAEGKLRFSVLRRGTERKDRYFGRGCVLSEALSERLGAFAAQGTEEEAVWFDEGEALARAEKGGEWPEVAWDLDLYGTELVHLITTSFGLDGLPSEMMVSSSCFGFTDRTSRVDGISVREASWFPPRGWYRLEREAAARLDLLGKLLRDAPTWERRLEIRSIYRGILEKLKEMAAMEPPEALRRKLAEALPGVELGTWMKTSREDLLFRRLRGAVKGMDLGKDLDFLASPSDPEILARLVDAPSPEAFLEDCARSGRRADDWVIRYVRKDGSWASFQVRDLRRWSAAERTRVHADACRAVETKPAATEGSPDPEDAETRRKGEVELDRWGVCVGEVPGSLRKEWALAGGALIERIRPNSSAARGGLAEGDILLAVILDRKRWEVESRIVTEGTPPTDPAWIDVESPMHLATLACMGGSLQQVDVKILRGGRSEVLRIPLR